MNWTISFFWPGTKLIVQKNRTKQNIFIQILLIIKNVFLFRITHWIFELDTKQPFYHYETWVVTISIAIGHQNQSDPDYNILPCNIFIWIFVVFNWILQTMFWVIWMINPIGYNINKKCKIWVVLVLFFLKIICHERNNFLFRYQIS